MIRPKLTYQSEPVDDGDGTPPWSYAVEFEYQGTTMRFDKMGCMNLGGEMHTCDAREFARAILWADREAERLVGGWM